MLFFFYKNGLATRSRLRYVSSLEKKKSDKTVMRFHFHPFVHRYGLEYNNRLIFISENKRSLYYPPEWYVLQHLYFTER